MQRLPFSLPVFTTVAIAGSAMVFALDIPQPPQPSAAMLRIDKCVRSGSCTAEEKRRVMGLLTEGMHDSLRRIDAACRNGDNAFCVNPSAGEMTLWRSAYRDMAKMAELLERENTVSDRKNATRLNRIKPAMGVPSNPYQNPDLEQLQRNKEKWWQQGWAPSNEANPYHKWPNP